MRLMPRSGAASPNEIAGVENGGTMRLAVTVAPIDRRGIKTFALGLLDYSLSNPWLVNFSVRLFSVTVRTI